MLERVKQLLLDRAACERARDGTPPAIPPAHRLAPAATPKPVRPPTTPLRA